jgi:hypothetical protein
MKIRFILAIALPVAAFAQTAPPTNTPVIPWQDPTVKILGNVAGGLPLEPIATLGSVPTRIWGPRAYSAPGKLLNLSALTFVAPGDRALTTGIAVSGGNRILLIRAVGPSLAKFGVSQFLSTPRLELFNSAGKSVAVAVAWSANNADTQIELRNTAKAVGAFPLQEGSADAVLLVLLQEGIYTCVVSAPNGTQGTVLLEAYNADSVSDSFLLRARTQTPE